jgi:exopolysaccharide biosynthesis polyprenyl glycosylphosphotransferase
MNSRKEKLLLLLVDFITINVAWFAFYQLRVQSGIFDMRATPDVLLPMLVIWFFWMIIFVFIGLYRSWFAMSRFDEISSLFKATFVGTFLLFTIVYADDSTNGVSSGIRVIILYYWGILFVLTSLGRAFIRYFQRYLLIKGFGRKNTVVIGLGKPAKEITSEINQHRGLGLDIIGYVASDDDEATESSFNGLPILGKTTDFEQIVATHNIKEIVFALENHQNELLVDIISRTENLSVGLKIVPNLYEILSGQAKSMQLYGVPLIDINPQLMPEWEKKVKRLMDIVIALLILVINSPMLLITAIAIKINSKGPVFYMQERCGLMGKPFKIVKFRSMRVDAETQSGPVWSHKGDPRVTSVGRFIRKVRIDEIPQMWNILKGEMSLIGPRPERPFFVEKLSKEIPYYKRRLRVQPGVTGWAQVKHKYDETIDDVKEKVKYDLYYIENMSLRMDFKIIVRTVLVVLFGKGHYN